MSEREGENRPGPEDMEPEDERTDDDLDADAAGDDAEKSDGAHEPAEGDGAPEGDDAGEGPAPATWAGRRQWEGLPSSGLTEEQPAATEPDPGETIEADTPALADQEEAREKAMAGLKARTAEGQAKRGVAEPEPPPSEDETEVAETPAEAEAEAQPEAKDEEAPPAPVAAAVADAEPPADRQKPPRSWLWARFVTASLVIIVSMATATSVSLLVYLTDIARGLGGIKGVQGELTSVEGGDPQNFLILGSDERPDQPGRGLSDTAILLRIDPDIDAISMLSIPRDLKTNVPGHGVTKFNEAYTFGGPKLTLRTVKDLTQDRIPITHVVNVDFNGFADAVDAIGCVYVDVDRHYFNDNSTVSFEERYAEINIEAGYQRLCGFKALQYVRYRHNDNDLVRAARQQSFLREARAQVPPDKLYDERNRLIDIFTSYTDSDIDDSAELVELFKLMLGARGAQINRVEFRTKSLNEGGYVTASDSGVQSAVSQFLNGGEASDTSEGESSGSGEGDQQGDRGDRPKSESKEKTKEPKPEEPSTPQVSLIDSTVSGQQYSSLLSEDAGDEIKFPILYPGGLIPGSEISDETRWFRIDGPGQEIYRGYKFVIPIASSGGYTSYYGVSGTNWIDAPLFANASEEREIKGRTYKLYYDTGHLRMVAFQKGRAMYWVTNTLDNLLSNDEMLAIALNLAVPGG